jgi:hypothetical protein
MRERNLRIALVVVDLFAALSAFSGAIGLIVGYMNIPLKVLHGTAFADFTVPALLLGIVVGGSALAAAAIALFGSRKLALFGPWRLDALASAVAGCIMVGWMAIEVALIGLDIWVQPVYFAVGLLTIGLAALLQQAGSQEVGTSGRQAESSQQGVSRRRRAA